MALDCLRGGLTAAGAAVLELDAEGGWRVAASAGLSEAARELTARHAPWSARASSLASSLPASPSNEPRSAPVWVTDLQRDAHWAAAGASFAALGIQGLVYVPSCFGERLTGALAVCFDAPRAPSDAGTLLAESVAAELALVIQHRRQLPTSDRAPSAAGMMRSPSSRVASLSHRERERAQLLTGARDLLASSLDPDAMLEQLASLLVPAIADYSVTYACEGPGIRRLGSAHRNPSRAPLLAGLLASGEPTRDDRHGPGAVIRTGAPLLAEHVTEEMIERMTLSPRHRQAVLALGPRSSIVVPLESRGRVVGAISLVATDESGRHYDADDLAFALELGQRVALLVDNARLYREARDAIRMRDDIIAVVSHDLRNPLNTISVASGLLDMSPKPEVAVRAQRSIGRAAKQMERLLQDLLDVSRAEAGGLSLALAPVDIVAVIDEAHALALPRAEDKAVKLERRVSGDLGLVDGDRDRLLQVLDNLLGNAIKFVPAGGTVTIGAQDLYGQIRVWISDDGPGISAENVPRVFDRFWQANRKSGRGAGLGLTIAKSIVDAHGGQIGVHSREGEGSTFFCWLPCSPDSPSRPAADTSAPRTEASRDAVPTPPGQ